MSATATPSSDPTTLTPAGFSTFQHLARLHVVGALDEEEAEQFALWRARFGEVAEAYLRECERLRAVFALTLRPERPAGDARARLLALVQRPRRPLRGSRSPVVKRS